MGRSIQTFRVSRVVRGAGEKGAEESGVGGRAGEDTSRRVGGRVGGRRTRTQQGLIAHTKQADRQKDRS